jgi:hypothetical protein
VARFRPLRSNSVSAVEQEHDVVFGSMWGGHTATSRTRKSPVAPTAKPAKSLPGPSWSGYVVPPRDKRPTCWATIP